MTGGTDWYMHLSSIAIDSDRFPTNVLYPFDQEILRNTERIDLTSAVTIFVGENGSGKSTLLRAICQRCGIHICQNQEPQRYLQSPYEDRLHEFIDVNWRDGSVPGSFFGSQTFHDFARILDEWAAADPAQLKHFGGASLMSQSHGQSLMSYFAARYRIKGLYFLDEPETALSPSSQVEAVRLIHRMALAGHAQFIIATHSPILMACPDADILSFDHIPLRRMAYEETEHYAIYKAFMADPMAYLYRGG